MVQTVRLRVDVPSCGLVAGDVLECSPYRLDPDKLTVIRRVRDGFDPWCNVYLSEVEAIAIPEIGKDVSK